MKSQRRFTEVGVALSFVILTAQAGANPVGEVIRAGSARMDRSAPGSLTIHQNSDRLVINWRDFSIAHGELTRFIQPSASSIALNRVVSANPSRIFGNLEANGKVYLINPNGILVGRGGAVNTRGFVATTLDVSDASFMSRAKLSLSGDSSAFVVNEGNIQAIGGDVFLVARTVENSGSIRAAAGTVGLAAGSEVVIVPSGKERISVIAGNANGSQAEKGVNNAGTIEAVSAELKAAGGNIYALAVNNGGIVRAMGVRREGGRVFLTSDGGNVENSGIIAAHKADGSGGSVVLAGGHNAENPSTVISSGVIDARGDAEGSTGGEVRLTGDYVGLFGASLIDVSGSAGGGTALIGGDYQGANSRTQNAQRTFVDDEASIKSDALAQGNGGKVIVWSDEVTRFSGSISARGGAAGGNGGFAEVSGKQVLAFNGRADLGASLGQSGSILLDPQDVTIQDTGANDALLGDSTLAFAEPDTATDVTISDNVLEALTGNILVQAHRNLFINEALTLALQTSGETVAFVAGGDLEINASVTTGGASLSFTASDAGGANSGTATLTIDANVGNASTGPISFINDGTGGIAVNAAVLTGDITVADAAGAQTATSGGITLNSGGPVTVAVSGSLTTGSAQVTGPAAGGDDAATSGNITITSGGAFVLNGTVVTGDATVGDENGDDTATTGNITVSASTSITGSGSATTGDALITPVGTGAGQNAATSGNINLTAGSGAVSGGIGLSGLAALTIGSATGANPPDPGANDEANAGSITLTSLDEINNGAAFIALSLGAFGAASGATINTPGTLVVTTTGAGGNVFLTSASDLNVGAVNTAAATPQVVSVSTSGGADLTVGDGAEGLLGDAATLDSGTGTLTLADTDFNVGAGSLTLSGSEIDLSGGNDSVKGTGALIVQPATAAQNIELAGAGSTAALDLTATDLDALDAGFTGITIGRIADGIGTLTVAGASVFNDDVTLVAGSIALNSSVSSAGNNVILTARTGNITDGNAAAANVIAAALTATAQTGIDLDTTITTLLNASVAGIGNINISDTAGGLAVTTATTADGDIALNATGGDLAVTTVTATGTGADVALSTTTSGDVAVGLATADGDAVSITSAGAVTDGNGVAVNVISDTLTVLAQSGIDLDTTITTLLNASVAAAGDINVADTAGGLIVTAASTANGGITFAADAGDLTVTSANAVGAGADITLTTTTSGDVNVGSLTASGDSVAITSVGAVTDGNGAAANVIADDLFVTSQTGIDLDTTITTLLNASVAGIGNINISDTAGGLAVTLATTADGSMTFNATGGDLDISTITAGGSGDIQLTTTTSGDVNVRSVIALGDTITVTSAGAIEELGVPDAGAEFEADDISLTAQSGIGALGAVETDILTLTLASVLGAGSLNIADETGGLVVTAASTANGNITVSAASGNLDVTTATAGGSGDIQLTTTISGDVNVGSVTATGDDVTVNSAGAIAELGVADGAADITGGTVNLAAATSIGGAGTELETDAATLNATAIAGGVFIREDNAVTLGTITAGTLVDIANLTANLTVGSVTAPGNITLAAQAGSVLDDGTAANITSSGGITDVASTGGSIGSAANPVDIESPGGAVNLTANSGGVHVNAVSAGDVQFQTSVSGSPVQTTFTQGGQTYTLSYANDLTVRANGNINAVAGVSVQAPGALTLRAVNSIGGGIGSPLGINAGTLNASAGTGVSLSEANDVTLGGISTTTGPLFAEAGGSFTFNGATVIDANAGTAILVANGLPGVIVSGVPTMDSRFILYALNARLTDPIVINNSFGSPTISGLVASRLDSPRSFNPLNPDPFGDALNYFVFALEANPPTDPSLFIDIPLEVFQPVSIVFGKYDPTKFGDVGDLWMSSSELYEIERKARRARKALPPQVGRAKYIPQSN